MKPLHLTLGLALAPIAGLALAPVLTPAAAPLSAPPAAAVEAPAHGVDEFHPDRKPGPDGVRPPLPQPAYGGRAIVHVDALPKSLCYAIESSGVTRRIHQELNATLLTRNWETYEIQPSLAESYTVEDRVVPKVDAAEAPVFGAVTDGGDAWIVEPVSPENPTHAERRIAKTDVERVERGSVFTFRLRSGVHWHDGHEFDARDVAFSLSIYANPTVRCDDKRFAYSDIVGIEVLAPRVVRVTYGHAYFMALMSLGEAFLLPSHLYDLDDPDNERRQSEGPDWKPSVEEQGRYVNENPHNRAFVGLGPYALAEYTNEYIEARRFDGYFDPEHGGYLDVLRWRAITDGSAAFRAALAGELDFFDTVTTDDYFSSALESKEITDHVYRGWHETSAYWFIGWNCRRKKLADPAVRRALAHAFDFEEFRATYYRGLAQQVTGPFPPSSPAYDASITPYPFDEKKAGALLLDAGWFDRDGDRIVDKDGEPLTIELVMQAGNPTGKAFAARYQESLQRIGVKLTVTTLDWAALIDRRTKGEFDAIALGWAPPFESDPDQAFHSRWGLAEKRGSNYVGFADPECDRLIDAGRAELDATKRAAVWRELHARLYEMQPYLFCYNPPRKFVMNRALHGFQSLGLDPNYSLRRWYYAAGTPGTRPQRAK